LVRISVRKASESRSNWAGADPDRVADVELEGRLARDELDHVAAAQRPVVVHQGVGQQLDLVERVAVADLAWSSSSCV
jgi:hypothetical protein